MPVIVAIFMTAMIVFGGVVVDGGYALGARERAANLAQEAARAGADAGSGDPRGISTGAITMDAGAAQSAAKAWVAAAGPDVTATVSVSGDTVTVTTHVTHPTAILSAFGVDTVAGDATATATALHGTTTEGS